MFSLGVEDINAHVQTVYTRPSPSPILEGLGMRLNLVWTPYMPGGVLLEYG